MLAAHEAGTTHVWTLSVGAMVAAIAGNQVGYMIGQRTGSKLHARRNARYLNAENLHKVNVLLDWVGSMKMDTALLYEIPRIVVGENRTLFGLF